MRIQAIPAFMLSEPRPGLQIGFVIFLPFLLVDLIVSSALMSPGMMTVPPASILLPLKVLMSVLMDGSNWLRDPCWALSPDARVGVICSSPQQV